MFRTVRHLVGAVALTAALLAVGSARADSPFDGNWKFTVLSTGVDINLWLLDVKVTDGKPEVKVVSSGSPAFKAATVENASFKDGVLEVDLKASGRDFKIKLHAPKGEKEPKVVKGSISFGANTDFAQMERTDLKEMEQKDFQVPGAEMNDYRTFVTARTPEDKLAAAKELIEKHPGRVATYAALQGLVQALASKSDGSADEIKKNAAAALDFAKAYGPDMELRAITQLAGTLTTAKKLPEQALAYAKQAAAAAESAKMEQQLPVLKTLAAAYVLNKMDAEAAKLKGQIAKVDAALDEEFLKTAIPFKPQAFEGRRSKSERVVLVELFTGAQCPPCVSADIAFDALLKTYKPSEAVFLQYHLHIPGPDPLTNADSEKRSQYYAVRGTPTVVIDGKTGPASGGFKQHAKDRYDALMTAIGQPIETPAGADLKLEANRKGEKITLSASADGVKDPSEKLRLRFVVIEDMARYAGSNGQRLHHHVVRAFPGGVDGFAVDKASVKQEVTVNVAELAKSLNEYLDTAAQRRPFRDNERPMELEHLKVVAFIQNDDTKEVLQAVQVDLSGDVK